MADEDNESAELARHLAEALKPVLGPEVTVHDLLRIPEGASRDTRSFSAHDGSGRVRQLVLKRDPPRTQRADADGVEITHGIDRATEARLMMLAGEAGVPEPEVLLISAPDSAIGAGFVMSRVAGESLGGRIVRRPEFAAARERLAFQCGDALARTHAIDPALLPPLRSLSPGEHLALYRDSLHRFDTPQPGFEYGIKWLEERLELAGARHGLVHGDFRNGNLLVGEDGLAAVLDWELGHQGDPMCDLGWLCVRSWRYGVTEKPVGGFGEREDLYAGYEAGGGGAVDGDCVRFWQIFGSLRWGIMCLQMGYAHISRSYRSIERAVIARRAAETEYDLLKLLD